MKRITKKGKNIYIRPPKYEETAYINKLWSDVDTTGEVGGPFFLPEEKVSSWFQKMVDPTDGHNFYCLIFNNKDEPVGEVSFHRFDDSTKTAELNIKIERIHRGKGYAKEALFLLLDYYFNEFGGEIMIDPVLLSNKKAQKMLLSFGFEHDPSNKEVFLLKMTKDMFNKIKDGILHT
ncbi:GNAT family N-acetyltransferase [Thermoanaerobacter uzonensis]|uniref:GNAT family N-acetyltransferase n=1 Tax=Thermoanaerobacter uzonensis TaxID=447593 RepID=UPI003D76871B